MSNDVRYKIVRFYKNNPRKRQVIKSGLTLEQAQAHCNDPETSSRTARSASARQRTRTHGEWFDGFTEGR